MSEKNDPFLPNTSQFSQRELVESTPLDLMFRRRPDKHVPVLPAALAAEVVLTDEQQAGIARFYDTPYTASIAPRGSHGLPGLVGDADIAVSQSPKPEHNG